MVDPVKVSKKAFVEFDGVKRNALIEICTMPTMEELTPLQRIAYLVFWYEEEVINGGHDQYFGNKAGFDQNEVVQALIELNANCQAELLRNVWEYYYNTEKDRPNDFDEFLAWYNQENGVYETLVSYDLKFNECSPTVDELLDKFLEKYEGEFIEWIP